MPVEEIYIDKKDQEAILYIAKKLEEDPNYGATLLNKVLYFADNISYLRHGKTITGFKYVNQDHGPTPRPRDFLKLRNKLIERGELQEKKVDFFGRVQKKYFAQREANIEGFTASEISLIDHVIEVFRDSNINATKASDLTHELLNIQLASHFEEIPFYTYLLTQANYTEEDLEWATSEIEKYESSLSDN